jgi:hypothetical protein
MRKNAALKGGMAGWWPAPRKLEGHDIRRQESNWI